MAESEGTLTGTVVGVYQIGEMIATGQLAEVYQAQHPGLPQPVALKVFVPGVAAHLAYMETMREIALRASLLKAPHILPIHGFSQEGDVLFLAMPLMYESLRSLPARTGALPLARAVALLREIAQGVAAAHAAGIIHRDLKPENVLLDVRGQAFVSDFGVGRNVPPEGAGPRSPDTLSSLIGTPAYMAPEQLRGEPTDQRTDVYALGTIFYEMLTGAPPYRGNTIYEVAAQALTTPVPPPSQRADGITPLLERAILRALARDPAERWPTVQRFIVGLDAALPALSDISDASDVSHVPDAPDASEAGEAARQRPPRRRTTIPLFMMDIAARAHDASEDAPPGSAPSSGDGAVVVPDLRLFRVDPLPPQPSRSRPTGLMLVGIVLALLGIIIAGGALLVYASQPTQSSSTPISPPLVPTQFIPGTELTPQPVATARPSIPPAPRPTATLKPRPQPTATSAPLPTVTPTSAAVVTPTP